jgi:hypothetical protein
VLGITAAEQASADDDMRGVWADRVWTMCLGTTPDDRAKLRQLLAFLDASHPTSGWIKGKLDTHTMPYRHANLLFTYLTALLQGHSSQVGGGGAGGVAMEVKKMAPDHPGCLLNRLDKIGSWASREAGAILPARLRA